MAERQGSVGAVSGSLARQLDAFMEGLLDRLDPATARVLLQAARAQAQTELAGVLRAGDLAPDFALPDQSGRVTSLRELLGHGPVVLTFFRGGWCPFCSIALRALDRIHAELRREGAELVAISPQTTSNAAATAERNSLSFPILADHGNAVARRYGLVWELQPEMQTVFERLGQPLPRINGTKEWTLPVPAGFVVNRDGRIAYAHVDARINRRLEPAEALASVRALAGGSPPGPSGHPAHEGEGERSPPPSWGGTIGAAARVGSPSTAAEAPPASPAP